MSAEDHDLIDSAMDKAIEKLDTPEAEAPAKEVEQPIESAPSEEVEAPEEITDQVADVETQEAGATEESDSTPIELPTFWPAELKAAAAKAPKEFVDSFSKYDAQRAEWANRVANEAEKGKSYEKQFYADFETPEEAQMHRAKLKAQGVDNPIAELHRYRQWDRVLELDPHTVISDLMRKNGFTPYDFTGEEVENPNQYQDPRVEDAIKRAEAAEKRIQEWEETQQKTVLQSKIDAFKDGVDSTGQVRRQFAELYAPQISNTYEAILKNYPNVTSDDALNHAYEYVKGEVSKIHGVATPTKPTKTKEQIIAESKKAQAAASSSEGAPNTGSVSQKPRLRGKNFNEKLDNALDIAFERHAH